MFRLMFNKILEGSSSLCSGLLVDSLCTCCSEKIWFVFYLGKKFVDLCCCFKTVCVVGGLTQNSVLYLS